MTSTTFVRIASSPRDVAANEWRDWTWQQRHAIHDVRQLVAVFPGLAKPTIDAIEANVRSVRIGLTPYALTLIERRPDGLAPLDTDPMWRQLAPLAPVYGTGEFAYDGETDNWELPDEMVTPIAQHKYPNRVILRMANVCHSYCQFCYEALRTLERDSTKGRFRQDHWDHTIDYVRQNAAIEEVILSGGEPLMNSDEQIDRCMSDLRRIGRHVDIRVHTRALTFNPFRVNDSLVDVFRRHRPAAVGLHVSHPNELTPAFEAAVDRLHGCVPILFANMPLLAGVNDDAELMHRLCMRLYGLGVVPHYLYHFMPRSPAGAFLRTTVKQGVDIVRQLKRRITNLAVPEFVLPHHTGKFTMPLLGEDEAPPRRWVDQRGTPFVRFTNWTGQVVDYADADGDDRHGLNAGD